MATSITENNGTSHDDTYLSEDSESTQGSDFDYDLSIDILLPDSTIKKTTVPANTPWADLRTKVCSQFKLSPSAYVIDFISSSTCNKKRKASRPVGRMSITMVTVQEKNTKNSSVKEVVTPHPVGSNQENTVRLLVRLARLRQSVMRVNPDVPLCNIFNNLCDKLKLNEEAKGRVEFRHPSQTEVVLNMNLSLNHYNLREVLLSEKTESKVDPPTKTKRKAPPPPRPAPPKSRPPPTKSGDKPSSPVEPVYAQIQPKPRPKKRRAAPPPPLQQDDSTSNANHDKVDKQISDDIVTKETEKPVAATRQERNISAEEIEEATEDLDKVIDDVENEDVTSISSEALVKEQNSAANEQLPSKPPRKHRHVKELIDDDSPKNARVIENNEKMSVKENEDQKDGDVSAITAKDTEAVTNDVTKSEEAKKSPAEQSDASGVKADDAVSLSEVPEDFVTVTSGDVTEPIEAATAELDDVVKQENNDISFMPDEIVKEVEEVMATSDNITEQAYKEVTLPSVDKEKKRVTVTRRGSGAMKIGDITVYDVGDDGSIVEDDETKPASLNAKSDVTTEFPDLPPPPPSGDAVLSFDDLPPPPPSLFDSGQVTPPTNVDQKPSLEEAESLDINEISTLPEPARDNVRSGPVDVTDNVSEEADDGFDLRVTEAFNITVPEDVAKANGNVVNFTEQKGTEEVPDTAHELNPEPAKEDAELTESEKTAKEIEKLHMQIKRMRTRNTKKQNASQTNRNTWHPGTHSFTFVPNKKPETTHADYDVAPVGGIELLNSGEIKRDSRENERKAESEVPQAAAPKLKSTLPSYYKKFLGVSAFAAKEK